MADPTTNNLIRLVRAELASATRNAILAAGAEVNRQAASFIAGMNVGAKGDLTRVHREIASDVRTAVRAAYATEVEAKRGAAPYKRTSRLSGHLGRVVKRNDLARGDAGGVSFVPYVAWDKEAAHWRRMNFGAGQRAGDQPGPTQLRVFGQQIGILSLGLGPSPAFSLPPGFFVTPGGKNVLPDPGLRGQGSHEAFYPNRKSPYTGQVTAGIQGRHFLEPGLEAIALGVRTKYPNMVQAWINAGGRKAKAIRKVVQV